MTKPTKLIFWLMFLLLFVTGSLGILKLQTFNFKLALLLPTFICLIILFSQKTVLINKSVLIWALIFLSFYTLSNLFSLNKFVSVNFIFTIVAGFYLMLFGALYKKDLEPVLPKIIFGLGVFFSVYSLFLTNWPAFFRLFEPNSGYNLVYSSYHLHNHLGDFLVLSILSILFYFKDTKFKLIKTAWLLIFGVLLFYSYSRSSYTALIAGIGWLLVISKQKLKTLPKLLGIGLILLAVVFLATTTTEIEFRPPWLSAIKTKPILNNRNDYWQAAYQSIKAYPLLGIGSGNFNNAMGRFSNIPFNWVQNSHNLFLAILAENGLLTLIAFLGLIISVVKLRQANLAVVLALSLFVNFQTDYTFAISGIWLLFWLLIGMSFDNTKNLVKISPVKLLFGALVTLFVLLQILLSTLLLQFRKSELAWLIYPLNQPALEYSVAKNLMNGSKYKAWKLLSIYKGLAPGSSAVNYSSGNIYVALGKNQLALRTYYQAYLWNPYENFDVYQKIYALEKKLNGQKQADKFLDGYRQKVKQIKDNSYFSQLIKTLFKLRQI